MKIYIIEKNQKNQYQKHCKSIFYKTVQKNLKKIGSRHNSTTEICRLLFKYENERKVA